MLHITTLAIKEILNGEEFFVWQCLEYDIKGIGSSMEEAHAKFKLNFYEQLLADKSNKIRPLSNIPPAPKDYWQKYLQACKDGMNPNSTNEDI